MAETLLHNSDRRIQDLQFQLQYLLEPIEKSRLELEKRTESFWTITALVMLTLGMSFFYFGHMILVGVIVLAIIVASIIYYKKIINPKNILKSNLNQNIIPHIIAEFLADSSFDAEKYISRQEYTNADLFRKDVDRYDGCNLISGILGETDLRFSKLHTEYKIETQDDKGRTKTSWHTIFEGILLIADSNKHIQGSTYIFPDTAERALGGVGRWFQEKFGSSGRGEMVYMENSIFEKLYVVYATDPVEARYLLTPAMQEYFIELSDYIGKDLIHASFIDGKLHLALSGSFDLFPFSLKRCLTEAETIKYYTENLLRILKVIEILDLNTRIWGK
ncbi:DUF3137 domain-containing protein [Dysgonomonas sp. OttesenSCG-928-M03]|nr:DUF3137 domain-containing protein [Dysgonomonas sp. OttesenSCG-928-M03]